MSNEGNRMYSSIISLRIKSTTLNRLDQKAKTLGTSRARILKALLNYYLSGEGHLPDNLHVLRKNI